MLSVACPSESWGRSMGAGRRERETGNSVLEDRLALLHEGGGGLGEVGGAELFGEGLAFLLLLIT